MIRTTSARVRAATAAAIAMLAADASAQAPQPAASEPKKSPAAESQPAEASAPKKSARAPLSRTIDYARVTIAKASPDRRSEPTSCSFRIPYEVLASPIVMAEPVRRDQIRDVSVWNSSGSASGYCHGDNFKKAVELEFIVHDDKRCTIKLQLSGAVRDRAFSDRIFINRWATGCEGSPHANRFALSAEAQADRRLWVHDGKIYLSIKDFLATAAGKEAVGAKDAAAKAQSRQDRAAQAAVLGALGSIATRGTLPGGATTHGGGTAATPKSGSNVPAVEPKKAATAAKPNTGVESVNSSTGRKSAAGQPLHEVKCHNGRKLDIYVKDGQWVTGAGGPLDSAGGSASQPLDQVARTLCR